LQSLDLEGVMMTATTVRFYFDPLCPWAWQGARWITAVSAVRDVEVEWRLFSLQIANAQNGRPEPRGTAGAAALRTLALIRRSDGNRSVGRAYRAMGALVHDRGVRWSEDAIRQALDDAGLDRHLVDGALSDESTMDDVRAEHAEAVDQVGCFGVPTIALPSGKGIFGPVVSTAPAGEQAGELWDRVRWFTELDGFFELKRSRDRDPSSSPGRST
jgi:2-hydroxychromene-2-carboxylate isomerase